MTQLIAVIFGYGILFRVICVIIAIGAAVYILYRHRPIPANGHAVEEHQKPVPKLNSPAAKYPVKKKFAHELRKCRCGGTPIYVEGYDTLFVQCPRCGRHTETIVGDYYDESFMMEYYQTQAAEMWNQMEDV